MLRLKLLLHRVTILLFENFCTLKSCHQLLWHQFLPFCCLDLSSFFHFLLELLIIFELDTCNCFIFSLMYNFLMINLSLDHHELQSLIPAVISFLVSFRFIFATFSSPKSLCLNSSSPASFIANILVIFCFNSMQTLWPVMDIFTSSKDVHDQYCASGVLQRLPLFLLCLCLVSSLYCCHVSFVAASGFGMALISVRLMHWTFASFFAFFLKAETCLYSSQRNVVKSNATNGFLFLPNLKIKL